VAGKKTRFSHLVGQVVVRSRPAPIRPAGQLSLEQAGGRVHTAAQERARAAREIISSVAAAACERLGLTLKQMEAALCCAKELVNKEIALLLGINERAVKARLRAVRIKIGVRSQIGIAYVIGGCLAPEERDTLDRAEFR
jgi:DNA-binding CsgD family transcriptional regulator